MVIENVKLELIDDNPWQPRSYYPPQDIKDLAYSIEHHGLRHTPSARQVNGRYQLADGHMRKRAFLKLQKEHPKKWTEMPLDIRDMDDKTMALVALEENLRRTDLKTIDVARAVDRFCTDFDVKETELAAQMNMTQGHISNMRRTLQLPKEILEKIEEGRINFTMGRELLAFKGLTGQPRYGYGGEKMDELALMRATVNMIRKPDGSGSRYDEKPATVDGIKKAIYEIAHSYFPWLEKETGYYHNDRQNPLFDTRAAECLKCEHMFKAMETKSHARHFCSNIECWMEKQKAHQEAQAAEAKRKMAEDVARRIAAEQKSASNDTAVGSNGTEPEKLSQQDEKLSQRPEDIFTEEELEALYDLGEDFDEDEEDEDEDETGEGVEMFDTVQAVCELCVNKGLCRGGTIRSYDVDDKSKYGCPKRTTKESLKEDGEKAKSEVPAAFKKLVKDAAGTRSEVLDIRHLLIGNWGDELKPGFVLLSGNSPNPEGRYNEHVKTLKVIDDPEECLKRCTEGFHYAYNSDKSDGELLYVCTNPKCLAKKKGAFTRKVNEAGQARKRAETNAIKKAAELTTELDKPRLLVIFRSNLSGRHVSGWRASQNSLEWFYKKLAIEKDPSGYEPDSKQVAKVMQALKTQPKEMLEKLLVEFALLMLTFDGENVKAYKIMTAGMLSDMGVKIKLDKAKKPEETAEPEKEVANA